MKRITQTLKIGLALFVAVFSNGLLPSTVAYAMENQNQPGNTNYGNPGGNQEDAQNNNNQGDKNKPPVQLKQVFCSLSDGKWKAQIGGPSSNPLLKDGEPVMVKDERGITRDMDQQCQAQYGVVALPAVPAVDDPCGPRNATWVKPENTKEVRWTLERDGNLIAETTKGFVFSDKTTNHNYGKAVDANAPCVTIAKTSNPVTDTNGDGAIGVGDVVTWKITVTNISEDKLDNYKVQITDSLATLENDGVIKHLEPGESVVLTATSVLTATDMQVCKATNTVSFQAWVNRRDDRDKDNKDGKDNGKFSQNMNHEDKDTVKGSATAEATFTCPTPGSGSSSTTTTSTSVPTSLPSTGPADGILLTPVVAAIAYGITYFIQRRRELATN